jgi:hypothetical protein
VNDLYRGISVHHLPENVRIKRVTKQACFRNTTSVRLISFHSVTNLSFPCKFLPLVQKFYFFLPSTQKHNNWNKQSESCTCYLFISPIVKDIQNILSTPTSRPTEYFLLGRFRFQISVWIQAILIEFFVIFLSPCRQMSGTCLKYFLLGRFLFQISVWIPAILIEFFVIFLSPCRQMSG